MPRASAIISIDMVTMIVVIILAPPIAVAALLLSPFPLIAIARLRRSLYGSCNLKTLRAPAPGSPGGAARPAGTESPLALTGQPMSLIGAGLPSGAAASVEPHRLSRVHGRHCRGTDVATDCDTEEEAEICCQSLLIFKLPVGRNMLS